MVPVIRARLVGHLTREALASELRRADDEVSNRVTRRTPAPTGPRVLVDCREMTDYDLDARHAFVDWLKTRKPSKVAIVTDRELWHLVIRAMSLASNVSLVPFATEGDALAWLTS